MPKAKAKAKAKYEVQVDEGLNMERTLDVLDGLRTREPGELDDLHEERCQLLQVQRAEVAQAAVLGEVGCGEHAKRVRPHAASGRSCAGRTRLRRRRRRYESHDARLLDRSGPAVVLVFYISKPWLDERRAASGRPFYFASPGIPIDAQVRQNCWTVLDRIVSPLQHADADIDSSQTPVKADGLTATAPELDHRLRAAITYMREHTTDATTAEDVAVRVGLSRGHFFALFWGQLNTTPQVFLSAVRVEEAVRRLLQEEAPLTSVALELGVFNVRQFFALLPRSHGRHAVSVSACRHTDWAALADWHFIAAQFLYAPSKPWQRLPRIE